MDSRKLKKGWIYISKYVECCIKTYDDIYHCISIYMDGIDIIQTIQGDNSLSTGNFFLYGGQLKDILKHWKWWMLWGFLKNSLIVSVTVLILQYLVIVPAAYAFARCKFKYKKCFSLELFFWDL